MVILDNDADRRLLRRPAVVVLVVLLVLGLAALAFLMGREQSAGGPPTAADGDELSQGEQVPNAAPEVQWRLWNGIALPHSTEHGPHQIDGAIASGYSRTAEGALIASVQIFYRLAASTADGSWRGVADRQLTGPGKEKLVLEMERVDGAATDSRLAQVAGFRFLSHTGDMAVIEIAAGKPGNYTVATRVLSWAGDDWRLVVGMHPSSRPAADLAGFTHWGGVN